MTFYNIFSKKEKIEKEKTKIITDNREKNSLVPSYLMNFGHIVIWEQLEIGDYIVNNTAIERKTISDLKNSIINKRIILQAKELQKYPSSLIIIEGPQEELSNNEILHENAIRGFLLFLVTKEKVPLLFVKNEEETAKYISLLARKKENSDQILRPSKSPKTKKELLLYILEGFPNVGPKKAKKLFEKFHTLENIINAREEELSEILGKNAVEFKTLLKFNFTQQL